MSVVIGTEGSEKRVVWSLAGPAIAQTLLHSAYGFNDYLFVSRLGGSEPVAALSASFGVALIVFGLSEVVAVGAQTLVAQLTGARAFKRRYRLLYLRFLLTVVLSLPVVLLGLFGLDPLLNFLNLESGVRPYARDYLRILLVGWTVRALMHTVTSVWRGMGATLPPVIIEGSILVLNTLGNGGLVLGWFGLPKLGIAGAALATIFSALIPTSLGIFLLLKWEREELKKLEKRGEIERGEEEGRGWRDIWEILYLGIPAGVMVVIYGIVFTAMIRLSGLAGKEAQAALGAALRGIEWVSWAVCVGFQIAAQVAVGHCVGAGDSERAKRITREALIQGVIVTQSIGLIMAVGSELWISFVVKDPYSRSLGAFYLRWIGATQLFLAAEYVLSGTLIGLGKTALPMKISLIMNLMRIPLIALWAGGVKWIASGTLCGLGLAPCQIPGGTDRNAFYGVVFAILSTTALKALWLGLTVLSLDFREIVNRRLERLQL